MKVCFEIPEYLLKKAEKAIESTEYKNLSEYVQYCLWELVREDEDS